MVQQLDRQPAASSVRTIRTVLIKSAAGSSFLMREDQASIVLSMLG
jgi:hypothetical protein